MKKYRTILLILTCFLLLAGCTETEKEAALSAKIPMVMVNDKLYYDTGKESAMDGRCGTMDGEIIATVDSTQIPTENNQSNFGTGYGYQFVADNTIEVYRNEKWCIFGHCEGNGSAMLFEGNYYNMDDISKDTLQWLAWYYTLTEEEQLSLDVIPEELLP